MESNKDFLWRMVQVKGNLKVAGHLRGVVDHEDFGRLLQLAEANNGSGATYCQVRDELAPFAVADYAKARGLLQRYGAERLSQLAGKNYGAFLVDLRTAKAKAAAEGPLLKEVQDLRNKAMRLGQLAGEVHSEANRLLRRRA